MEQQPIKKQILNEIFYLNFIEYFDLNSSNQIEQRNLLFENKLYKTLIKIIKDFIKKKVVQFEIDENELIDDMLTYLFLNFNKYKRNRNDKNADNAGSLYLFIRFQLMHYLSERNKKHNKKLNSELRLNNYINDNEIDFDIADSDSLNEIEKLFYEIPRKIIISDKIKNHILNIKLNKINYYKNEFENEIKIGKSLINIYLNDIDELSEIDDIDELNEILIEKIKKQTGLINKIEINYFLYKYINDLQ